MLTEIVAKAPRVKVLFTATLAEGDALNPVVVHDYQLQNMTWTKAAVPQIGECSFDVISGLINGAFIEALSALENYPWVWVLHGDPDVDLKSDGAWNLMWIGRLVSEFDHSSAAAEVTASTVIKLDTDLARSAGVAPSRRTYRAVDPLYWACSRTPLKKHQWYSEASYGTGTPHPGFNAEGPDHFGSDVGGLGYDAHTWPHKGDLWTDAKALAQVMCSSVFPTELQTSFNIIDSTLLGNCSQIHKPRDGATVWDFLVSICRPSQGRPVCLYNARVDGPAFINHQLIFRPRQKADITFTNPVTGAEVTIAGAEGTSHIVSPNLLGDVRVPGDGYKELNQGREKYQYIEVLGSKIRTMVTLSFLDGTLEGRWNAELETPWTLTDNPLSSKWDGLYSLYGHPNGWNFSAKDGTGLTTASRCDYQCDDNGSIVSGASGYYGEFTSPFMAKIEPTLPIWSGYDYATTQPVPYESGTTRATQSELPIFVWGIEIIDDTVSLYNEQIGGVTAKPDRATGGLSISANGDQSTGVRRYEAPAYERLGVTVSYRLPHRVRIAKGDPTKYPQKRIELSGAELWLAHPGAIWGTDPDTFEPLRNCAGSTGALPGIIRDDRDKIAYVAALAGAYMLETHRAISWTQRIDPYEDRYGNMDTPDLGDLVDTISVSGEVKTVDTPITLIRYDHSAVSTTYSTSWADLEFS